MNIVFLSRFDLKNINDWSGTMYHVYNKLKEKHFIKIIGTEILKQFSTFKKRNFSENTFIPAEHYVQNLGKCLSDRIKVVECDLIFFGDIFFNNSDFNFPYVLLSDMTFEQIIIHYKNRKPDERHVEHGYNLERKALNSACRIIYSSEWIKQKAIEFYQIDPKKIEVVEFGANIPEPDNYSIDIACDFCRLLFVGMDWERKNGDLVLQLFELLKKDGFPCTLTIIGSVPNEDVEEDDDLTIIPFLDKSDPDDLKRFCQILSESHFLVLPTKFDAFGIVFCEASAYAVPSIAADVGGVPQAVKEGKNGYLLPPDSTAADYAEKIKTVFNDKEGYLKLRQSSRYEYETRLNWDVWGEKVNKILEDAVNQWKMENGEWRIPKG